MPGNATGLSYKHDRSRVAQGVAGSSVCTILPVGRVQRITGVAGLRSRGNDSMDLSICRYARGAVNVRVVLDGAADATRRFANLLSEAAQRFNAIPGLRPRDVAHVGEDDDYGGTGAYWTRDRDQLVAYSADRIVRVTVHVPGRSDARRKAASARLARAVFAAMPKERDG
jgi:hypothetical protein